MNRATYIEKFGPDYADAFCPPRAEPLRWIRDDGGRVAANLKAEPFGGGCVVRALAIATGEAYADVLAALSVDPGSKGWTGVPERIYGPFLSERGWSETKGNGRLREGAVPTSGPVIVRTLRFSHRKGKLVGHLAAIVDGAVRDTFDSTQRGQAGIVAFWLPPGVACADP